MGKRGAMVIVAALLLAACDTQGTGDDAKKPAVKSGVVFVEDKGERKPRRRANTPRSCITQGATVMCVGTE